MCDLRDEDTATVWNVEHPEARTEHQCDCCYGRITRGEHYALTSALSDGAWSTEKACFGCATIIHEFGEEHRFYPSANSFAEYLSECVRDEDDNRWAPALASIGAQHAGNAAVSL